jgi:hypothetical protein
MKRKFNIKGIASILAVMILALVVGTIFGAFAIGGVVLGVGVAVAGEPVSQQIVDAQTNSINMPDVQRKVELYKPYQTPLLTLMSDQSNGTVEGNEYQYFAVDARGLDTTVSSGATLANSSITLAVSDSLIFTKNCGAYFTSITGATKISSGRSLAGIVTGVTEGFITVKLVNPGVALAASDFTGVKVYRGGSAHNEKTASTTSWGAIPDMDYNYVQYFLEQIEVTDYEDMMKKQVDWNFADMKRMAIDDFKLQRERTFLNGVRSKTSILVDGSSQDIYTCGGFLQDTGIPVESSITLSTLTGKIVNGLTKNVFTGNNGSNKRFVLGGADFIEALENVYVDGKYILAKQTDVVLGIEFIQIASMFGVLDVAYYEQLDLLGMAKTAIVIDKANIGTKDMKGGAFNIDLKTSGISKVNAAAIEQYSTMTIKNKITHSIWQGV